MDTAGGSWGLLTIIGPVLLAAMLLWAMLRNRKTKPRDDAETERATHELYQETDREDKARENKVER